MNCTPSSDENRPIERVLILASQIQYLTPQMAITPVFEQFRESLWQLIEVSNDPNVHVLAWNTIDQWAKADLAEYEATGNTDALERLKDKVRSAVELL